MIYFFTTVAVVELNNLYHEEINMDQSIHDFKKQSNEHILISFDHLVRSKRKITQSVLECIVEIDRRKIYLDKAFPSLFEFLVKGFGYSPSAAMRRIESARLLREIPEISNKIESGSVNLSQLSKVQQAARLIYKTSGQKISTVQKIEVLKKIENTTQAKTDLILAQEFDLPAIKNESEKINRDESITLTISFSKEQMALLQKAQALVSHSVPNVNWAELFTYLATKEIKSRSPKATQIDSVQNDLQTISLRKRVLNPKSACCQFKDPITNKKCESLRFLQMDHIKPKWAGGEDKLENYQILCAAHNRHRYQKQSNLVPLR